MKTLLSSLLLAAALGGVTGCSQQSNGDITPTQRQSLDRTTDIIAKSGGDWSKLSPEDKQLLIKGPGYGNEEAARSFLIAAAARRREGLPKPAGPPSARPSPH